MIKVELTENQTEELKKLWFVYGNSGKKSTLFNHKYIQGFLEVGEDRKEPYLNGIENLKGRGLLHEAITIECIEKVEKIVYNKSIDQ